VTFLIIQKPSEFQRSKDQRLPPCIFQDKAEPGKKTVLGKEYPNGIEALKLLVDDLSNSDHTARFLTQKLCVHFIADEPTEQDLNHVFSAWKDSGGDLNVIHEALLNRASPVHPTKVSMAVYMALNSPSCI
jgi:uncharacterized protein (DUF1800 family)